MYSTRVHPGAVQSRSYVTGTGVLAVSAMLCVYTCSLSRNLAFFLDVETRELTLEDEIESRNASPFQRNYW